MLLQLLVHDCVLWIAGAGFGRRRRTIVPHVPAAGSATGSAIGPFTPIQNPTLRAMEHLGDGSIAGSVLVGTKDHHATTNDAVGKFDGLNAKFAEWNKNNPGAWEAWNEDHIKHNDQPTPP